MNWLANKIKALKNFEALEDAFSTLMNSRIAMLEDGKAYLVTCEGATKNQINKVAEDFKKAMDKQKIKANVIFINANQIVQIGGDVK